MNERDMERETARTRQHTEDAKLSDMAKRAASLADDRVRSGAERRDAQGRPV